MEPTLGEPVERSVNVSGQRAGVRRYVDGVGAEDRERDRLQGAGVGGGEDDG
jgi:hypothetical protein